MRIFSKKKFKFRQGGQSFTVDPLIFTDAPDWIIKDRIFKLAIKDGDIEVLNSKKDEKRIEKKQTEKTQNPDAEKTAAKKPGAKQTDAGQVNPA